MWISWRDERYIAGNEQRITDCESNQVIWTEAEQFWLPKLFVWNVIELVIFDLYSTLCGVHSVVKVCFVSDRKFRLPTGLHSSCSISPQPQWNMSKIRYKISGLSGRPIHEVYMRHNTT